MKVYVIFFCFQEKAKKCEVEFSTWEASSAQLVGKPLVGVVNMQRRQQINCSFGAVDLSIPW